MFFASSAKAEHYDPWSGSKAGHYKNQPRRNDVHEESRYKTKHTFVSFVPSW